MSSSKILGLNELVENGLESDIFGVSEISGDISAILAEVIDDSDKISYVVGVIRHGKTLANIDGEDNPKGIDVSLIQEELDGNGTVAESIEKLIQMGYNKDNIIIYTANETVRINQTLGIICRKLGIEFQEGKLGEIKGNDYIVYDERLKAREKGGTEKDPTIQKNIAGSTDKHGQESLMNAMNRTAAVIGETVENFGQKDQGKLHLFVGYRTMYGGFEHKIEGKQIEEKTTQAGFGEVKLVGLDKDKKLSKGGFVFDTNNFEDELEIWDKIFMGKLKKSGRTLFEYQNIINHYVDTLKDENKIESLSISLITQESGNLIKFGLDMLYQIGRINKIQHLIFSLQDTLLLVYLEYSLERGDNSLIDFIIKHIFINNRTLFFTLRSKFVDYSSLFIYSYYEKVFPRINEIRQRSLDGRVRQGNEKLIDYDLVSYTSGFINDIDKGVHYDFNSVVFNGLPVKFIEGTAGSGKSFFLVKLCEYYYSKFLSNDGEYFPIFLNLSNIVGVSYITQFVEESISCFGGRLLILLDSLDESGLSYDDRKLLDLYIIKLINRGHKVLITSRAGFYNQQKYYEESVDVEIKGNTFIDNNYKEFFAAYCKNFEIVYIETIKEIDEFIRLYFGGNENLIGLFNDFLSKDSLKGLETNPLLISIICYLIKKGISLENIKNISSLYEKIVDTILLDWNKLVVGRNISGINNDVILSVLENRKLLLSKIAMELSLGKNMTMDDIVVESKKLGIENSIGSDLFSLGLLYESHDGLYNFVHEKFKEHFFIRGICYSILLSKNKEYKIFIKTFFANILQQLGYEEIDFIIELLKTDSKISSKLSQKNIERFVDSLTKYHREGGKIIYILGKLGYHDKKNRYIESIKITGEEIIALGKLGTEEDIAIVEKYKFTYIDEYDDNGKITFIEPLEVLSFLGKLNLSDFETINFNLLLMRLELRDNNYKFKDEKQDTFERLFVILFDNGFDLTLEVDKLIKFLPVSLFTKLLERYLLDIPLDSVFDILMDKKFILKKNSIIGFLTLLESKYGDSFVGKIKDEFLYNSDIGIHFRLAFIEYVLSKGGKDNILFFIQHILNTNYKLYDINDEIDGAWFKDSYENNLREVYMIFMDSFEEHKYIIDYMLAEMKNIDSYPSILLTPVLVGILLYVSNDSSLKYLFDILSLNKYWHGISYIDKYIDGGLPCYILIKLFDKYKNNPKVLTSFFPRFINIGDHYFLKTFLTLIKDNYKILEGFIDIKILLESIFRRWWGNLSETNLDSVFLGVVNNLPVDDNLKSELYTSLFDGRYFRLGWNIIIKLGEIGGENNLGFIKRIFFANIHDIGNMHSNITEFFLPISLYYLIKGNNKEVIGLLDSDFIDSIQGEYLLLAIITYLNKFGYSESSKRATDRLEQLSLQRKTISSLVFECSTDNLLSELSSYRYFNHRLLVDYLIYSGVDKDNIGMLKLLLLNNDKIFKYFYESDFEGKDIVYSLYKSRILENVSSLDMSFTGNIVNYLEENGDENDKQFLINVLLSDGIVDEHIISYILLSFFDTVSIDNRPILKQLLIKYSLVEGYDRFICNILNIFIKTGDVNDLRYLNNFLVENASSDSDKIIFYYLKSLLEHDKYSISFFIKFIFSEFFDKLILTRNCNLVIEFLVDSGVLYMREVLYYLYNNFDKFNRKYNGAKIISKIITNIESGNGTYDFYLPFVKKIIKSVIDKRSDYYPYLKGISNELIEFHWNYTINKLPDLFDSIAMEDYLHFHLIDIYKNCDDNLKIGIISIFKVYIKSSSSLYGYSKFIENKLIPTLCNSGKSYDIDLLKSLITHENLEISYKAVELLVSYGNKYISDIIEILHGLDNDKLISLLDNLAFRHDSVSDFKFKLLLEQFAYPIDFMNRNNPEPSMEELLARIRKIINDSPV